MEHNPGKYVGVKISKLLIEEVVPVSGSVLIFGDEPRYFFGQQVDVFLKFGHWNTNKWGEIA